MMGNNNFENNTFSSREWSANIFATPSDIQKELDKCNLVGRKIVDIKVIGLSYEHSSEMIDEVIYNLIENLSEEERAKLNELDEIPDVFGYYQYMEIDEPLLIKFADKDRFEICEYLESVYRMSMNVIPWDISYGINEPNAHANIIFEDCIGETITDVEVKTVKVELGDEARDFLPEGEDFRVEEVILWLSNGKGIAVSGECHDFTTVYGIENDYEISKIKFSQLKRALMYDLE